MKKIVSITDKLLIENANKVHYTEWYLVSNMIDVAESDETKNILNKISNKLYKMEESKS